MRKGIDYEREQVRFVFKWFIDNSINGISPPFFTGVTAWDDDLEFVEAFVEKFPGRTPDPSRKKASRRLRKRLKKMYDDGWLRRQILGNDFLYHPDSEPRWQYAYRMHDRHMRGVRQGTLTADDVTDEYLGK